MNAHEETPEIPEKNFEEMLNETYGDVCICGLHYASGTVLRDIDYVAFRCAKNDYEDGLGSVWACEECGTQYCNEDEAEDCCVEFDGYI